MTLLTDADVTRSVGIENEAAALARWKAMLPQIIGFGASSGNYITRAKVLELGAVRVHWRRKPTPQDLGELEASGSRSAAGTRCRTPSASH
jgi:hypothetical protein